MEGPNPGEWYWHLQLFLATTHLQNQDPQAWQSVSHAGFSNIDSYPPLACVRYDLHSDCTSHLANEI